MLLAFGAGALGFVLNEFGLPVFGGTEIVLGGWATLLVVYTLGPGWGMLATAIAFSRTVFTWGHPWGLLIFTLEALVVGWLKHRRHTSALISALIYWLLIGIPLTIVAIVGLSETPFPNNWAVVFKYPVNSLLMAMLALPVYHSRFYRQLVGLPLDVEASTPLQRVLFRRVGNIIALSIAVLGLFVGQMFDRSMRQMATDQIVGDCKEVTQALLVHLDRYQRVLTLLAANHTAASPAIVPQDHLDQVREQYPGFLTLLSADRTGLIVAASPAVNHEGRSMTGSGLSVGDREYFKRPMANGRPFTSSVFRGRGFGGDLIVAMSAPVKDPAGQPVSLVEGSLNLNRLIEDICQPLHLEGRSVIIVDRNNRVIASHGQITLPTLHFFKEEQFYRAAQAKGPEEDYFLFNQTLDGGFERFIGTRQMVPGFGWRIYLAEPVWKAQRIIAGYYLTTGLAAGVAIGLALLLARAMASEITRPLEKLVGAVRRLASQGSEGEATGPDVPQASRELAELSRELHGAALTLSRTNRELANTMTERDRSHEQLRQVLLHLEEKVRERTSQLDEARRAAESANAAKSEFLASMSHELRTPLNVILGMSELVMERSLGPLTDRQAEGVQSINESGRHLLDLINDILDLSKIEAGMLELDFQPTEVADLCAASTRFVTESARRKGLALRTEVRPAVETIIADERRLKQILVNLLANAVKFTPAGGEVGLDVRVPAGGATIRFEVWDTGIGIAPEHFEKVFQPFRQIDSSLSRQYAGTGLGLTLVRRMAELHGGTVELESTVGRGSRFSVVIPLRRPPAPTGSTPNDILTETAVPILPPRIKILIAEDNESNNMVYAGYFRSKDCELIMATNGRQAVDLALQHRPDIILMDVHMPEMDGLEATRRLRADPRTDRIPIITVTALAMPEDRVHCLEAGASAYLSKPINLRELGRMLSRFAPRPGAPSSDTPVPS